MNEVIVATDLTNSKIDRQNILNNNFAVSEIEKACSIKVILQICLKYLLLTITVLIYNLSFTRGWR